MADDTLEWHRLLSQDLLSKAYRAENGELAWSRPDAVEVIRVLRKHAYLVIGVDIWIPTTPGPTIPTPFVYDWSFDGFSELQSASPEYRVAADEFVREFAWDGSDMSHQGREPHFNIQAQHSDA